MDSGDTLVILKSDGVTLLASGRVVDVNIDESKVEIRIEESRSIFYLGDRYLFELLENDDGTYEALLLQKIPNTNGMVNRLLSPRFIIGGPFAEGEKEGGASPDCQPALF